MCRPVWRYRTCVTVYTVRDTPCGTSRAPRVAHRVPQARLKRAYFVGRAYWQGRSEALTQYAGMMRTKQAMRYAKAPIVKSVLYELRDILHLALVQRPLLHLAAAADRRASGCWLKWNRRVVGDICASACNFLSMHLPKLLHQRCCWCVRRARPDSRTTCTFTGFAGCRMYDQLY